MAYASVSYGSTGANVKALQEKLNRNGYQLEVDGVFGAATGKAVKDYQKKKGLQVDGIVGEETWGSLLKTPDPTAGPTSGKQVLSGVSDETYDRLASLEKGYAPSDEVLAAQAVRESVSAMRPEDYVSGFEEEIAALYDRMVNRQPFTYDPAQDAAYEQYARLYEKSGRAAMEDTLGQAAALSGGYGSSYAQTAAQQAYNAHLQQLSALLPQLEENARERYAEQGEAMSRLYDAALEQEKAQKAAWESAYDAWVQQWKQADQDYQDAYDRDYGIYKAMLDYFADKAASEQKASGGAAVNSGKVQETASGKGNLSAAAGESLSRAMGNYLKAGKTDAALALVSQYAGRMTAAQKKRFTTLFDKYGVTLTW